MDSPFLQVIPENGGLIIVQPLMKPCTAVIFGAGHVARPTAHLSAMFDFQVTVIDDRAEFVAPGRFPDAYEVRAIRILNTPCQTYRRTKTLSLLLSPEGISMIRRCWPGPQNISGIHRHDRQPPQTENHIYRPDETGIHPEGSDRVHSPISLSIGAETPEEIAFSIVSEMIQIRAEMRK